MSGLMKTLREDRRLTQGQLAVLVRIRRQQTIANWERGVARTVLADAAQRVRLRNPHHA